MHRSRIVSVALGLALAFCLAAAAPAQEGKKEGRRGGGGGGFGGAGFGGMQTPDKPILLGSEQVRGELKIVGDQAKKVEEVLASHREALPGLFSRGSRDASDEERKKAREEAAAKRAELLKKTEAKLAEVLNKDQAQRLDEIALQQQGADALVADNVIASLKLSKEQTDKIKGTLATRDEELAKLRSAGRGQGGGGGGGGGRGNFEEVREKSDKLRKDAETTVLATLTKEQTESFQKMKGTPFELDRRSLFRGQGQGGGRQGGGGRGGEGGTKERRRPAADDDKDKSTI